MGEKKKKLKPLDYKELYRNKIKQGTWYIDEIFKLKEENKLLKSKLEKAKEALKHFSKQQSYERHTQGSTYYLGENTILNMQIARKALKEIEGLE